MEEELVERYGAKSDQALAFHLDVYETVRTIPPGHVTSYGHIALLVGAPENSRQVGFALKKLPRRSSAEERFQRALPPMNTDTVPWWRVINSSGKISLIAENKARQAELLTGEGVEVADDGKVLFSTYGWFPDSIE